MWTFIGIAILEWNGIIVLQELLLRMLLFISKCSQRRGMEGGSWNQTADSRIEFPFP